MTGWERIEAAIAGVRVDRVPWALWRHFPGRDTDPRRLAEATVAFQKRFGFDLVKVTPAGGYTAEAWGARLVPRAGDEGARDCVSRVVSRPEDWRTLRIPPLTSGVFRRELDALRRIRRGVDRGVPVLQTIFSPLSTARALSGDLWHVHLHHRPADLEAGLETIADATAAFARRCLEAGADGLFFAVQVATADFLTDADYRRFGEPYDRRVLDAVRERTPLILLHVHGLDILFDRLRRYPVSVMNWHDRRTPPPLPEGLRWFGGACLGGLDERGVLRHGTPAQIRRDVARTIRTAGERRIILGAGCVIPIDTPAANLDAVGRCLM
jgi:uroporphyrinogen decarboxylase